MKPIVDQRIEGRSFARGGSQRGFSYGELLITMQFLVLGSLIAAPTASSYFSQYQLLSASNQLAFDIARARMQATATHRYVRIKMVSSTQYARQTSTDGTTWSNSATISLPSRITTTQTSAEILFNKRGIASTNVSVTLSNGLGKTKVVTTNVVGRVTIA